MKEQYVTYEQAVKLKELGFDEPTSHYYCAFDNETDVRFWDVHPKQSQNAFRSPKDKVIADAPRLDQAAAWLREVKGIYVYPEINCLKKWFAKGVDMERNEDLIWDGSMFDTYEQVMSYSIDAALELLTDKQTDK